MTISNTSLSFFASFSSLTGISSRQSQTDRYFPEFRRKIKRVRAHFLHVFHAVYARTGADGERRTNRKVMEKLMKSSHRPIPWCVCRWRINGKFDVSEKSFFAFSLDNTIFMHRAAFAKRHKKHMSHRSQPPDNIIPWSPECMNDTINTCFCACYWGFDWIFDVIFHFWVGTMGANFKKKGN